MRTLLTPALLLASVVLSAQITVTYDMLSPFGVATNMYVVTAPGSASMPGDGANQTWDLSTIVLQATGTLNFTAASNTPFAGSYPAANWAWVQTVTGVGADHAYLDINPAGMYLVADLVPANTNTYTDTKRFLQFPMAFGESFTDPYTDNDGPASVTWTYSGHGTAITPLGTYTNVVKIVSDEGDVLLWSTDPLYPIVIDKGSSVLVFGATNVGVNEPMAATLRIAPNPCTDQLVVSGFVGAGAWTVTDLQGRNVLSGSTTGAERLIIDTQQLQTGIYLLKTRNGSEEQVVRFSRS